MSTNAPVQAYTGYYHVENGPTLDQALDSLKYRWYKAISVPVTFTLISRGEPGRANHTGQISGFNYAGYADKSVADLVFDGPFGQLKGWYNFKTRKGLFRART